MPCNFESLIPILDAAIRTESSGHPYGIEALQRLEQLHWLAIRVEAIEPTAHSQMTVRLGAPYQGMSEIEVELLTLTESFYYIAWRLIGLLDRDDAPVAKLKGMRKACVGIRTVRNQLLEHPEGANSGVSVPAIVFGHGCGPQLKVIKEVVTTESGEIRFKTVGADLFDKGLWNNAQELSSFMASRLQNGA